MRKLSCCLLVKTLVSSFCTDLAVSIQQLWASMNVTTPSSLQPGRCGQAKDELQGEQPRNTCLQASRNGHCLPAQAVNEQRSQGSENGHGVSFSVNCLQLPQPFLEFLDKSGVDPAIYSATKTLPRYIRLKQGIESERTTIESELGLKLCPVPWLQGFFSMPSEVHIAGSQAYQLGKIYGMDAASGAAVAALGVIPGDHVLDLCAAPGAKLCMITDLLGGAGTVTGVDITRHRLAACRTMLLKYGVGKHCRLFVADGTKFSLLPFRHCGKKLVKHAETESIEGVLHDSKSIGDIPMSQNNGSILIFGEWTSRRTRKEKQLARWARMRELKLDPQKNYEPELFFYGRESGVVGTTQTAIFENSCKDGQTSLEFGYDKVLVDADCTHDGSLKHISKYERWGWDTLERRVLGQERLASITCLQLQLLTNGFRLLKVGGTLVYSTCSFTTAQNEEIVDKFLAGHANAVVKEIELASEHKWPCKHGGLTHSLRFDPLMSMTSGLFVVKIIKKGNSAKKHQD